MSLHPFSAVKMESAHICVSELGVQTRRFTDINITFTQSSESLLVVGFGCLFLLLKAVTSEGKESRVCLMYFILSYNIYCKSSYSIAYDLIVAFLIVAASFQNSKIGLFYVAKEDKMRSLVPCGGTPREIH